jgi:hypothetical protein
MIGIAFFVIYSRFKHAEKARETFIVSMLGIVLLIQLTHDISGGLRRIQTLTTSSEELSFIKNVPITPEDKVFYDTTIETLRKIFTEYPEKTYINDSGGAIYPLMYPSHFVSFHGIYAQWDFITTTADPKNDQEKKEYIRSKSPLLFTRDPELYPEYCDSHLPSLDNPPIRLLLPRQMATELQWPSITCPAEH